MPGGASWSSPDSPMIQRGQLLLQQGRAVMAEEQFRLALSQDDQAALPHVLLAYALAAQQKYEAATFEAQQAIALEPENSRHHQALGWMLLQRNRNEEADASAKHAVALDPHQADAWSLCAAIAADRKDWREALEHADRALQQDAEHEEARNLRVVALRNLGRHEEARQTLGGTLERNPDNAFTHANAGWAALHAGGRANVDKALEHFREALRLEADNSWAKAGMVEALKAKHLVYRLMLKWFLWMGSLKSGVQWGVIIAIWLGSRALSAIAERSPSLAPFMWTAVGGLVLFVWMTWVSYPLFNLILRLSPFGRHALDDDQRKGATLLGSCLLIATLAGAAAIWGWGAGSSAALPLTGVASGLFLLAMPVSAIYMRPVGWLRNMMAIVTCLLALLLLPVAAWALTNILMSTPPQWLEQPAMWALLIAFMGIALSQLLAHVTSLK